MTDRRDPPSNVIEYRVDALEDAVRKMADAMSSAADKQATFNENVTTFMSAAKTWGKVGLITHSTLLTVLVAVIAYYASTKGA